MIISKEEAVREHRKMWKWIALKSMRTKRKVQKIDYFGAMRICFYDAPMSLCYCCEYADQNIHKRRCETCPVEWPSSKKGLQCCDKKSFSDRQGLFSLWKDEKDYKKAALLAYKISKLPERKKKK